MATNTGIFGVADSDLTALLKREYARDTASHGALHPLAQEWNNRQNSNRMTMNNPFGTTHDFNHNFKRAFPSDSHRIEREKQMLNQDRAVMADTLQRMANTPGMHLGMDQATGIDMDDTVATALNTIANASPQMTYDDILRAQRDMKAMHETTTHAPLEPPTDPEIALEFQLNGFLDMRNDIDIWFTDLSSRLGLTNVETLEVALRMAMEVTYKEEEAKISGLNRKLKAMENGEGDEYV